MPKERRLRKRSSAYPKRRPPSTTVSSNNNASRGYSIAQNTSGCVLLTSEEKTWEAAAKEIIKFCFSTLDRPKVKNASISSKREGEIKSTYEELKRNLRTWKPKYKTKIFNDSIHKTVVLNPVEVAIIQTPEFFRLKNIKQLGGTCHVYPGAVHTRFEHSIGVCHLAGEFVRKLSKNHPGKICEKDEVCVRLAGLCHDLGHGPFSHLFDGVKKRVLKDSKEKSQKTKGGRKEKESHFECLSHEALAVLIFKWILVKHLDVLITFVSQGLVKEHVEMIANMIDLDDEYKETRIKAKNDEYLFEIVANKSSGLDVDKWDYFTRDCHHLGLTNEFDYWRTMELGSIVKFEDSNSSETFHVGFMNKEIHNIIRMFRTRSVLYQKAYMHTVVKGIEMMIVDIICESKDETIFHNQSSLRNILEKSVVNEVCDRDLSGYCNLTDSILDIIHNADLSGTEAPKIMKNFMMRNLYWCCCEGSITWEDMKGKDRKEKKKETEKKEKKLKSILRKENFPCDTETVKISYASEACPNPAEDVYFYDKEKDDLPVGYKLTVKQLTKTISKLHTPKTYTEYHLRGYCKDPSSVKDRQEVRKRLDKKVEELLLQK